MPKRRYFLPIFLLLPFLGISDLIARTQDAELLLSHEGVSNWRVGEQGRAATILWQRLRGLSTSEPVNADSQILVGSSAGLFALNRSDGSTHWHLRGDDHIYSPSLINGIAYAASRDGILRAVNANNGALEWQHSLSGWIYRPAMSGDTLVTGGSDSTLWGIHPLNGLIRWQHELPGELVNAPLAISDAVVVAATFSRHLTAYRGESGQQLWQSSLTSPALQLVADNHAIYSSGYDGVIHAIDLQTGQILWQQESGADRTLKLQIIPEGLLLTHNQSYQLLNSQTGTPILTDSVDGEMLGGVQRVGGNYWIFSKQAGQRLPVKLLLNINDEVIP